MQHLEQLISHPKRNHPLSVLWRNFLSLHGHVTSGRHATFDHEHWYILYYYYSKKKKSAGMYFRACAEHTSGYDVTSGHVTSCDVISVRAGSGDVTSSNTCVMATSPLLLPTYALSYPYILLGYLDLGGNYTYLMKKYRRTAKFFATWGLCQRYYTGL